MFIALNQSAAGMTLEERIAKYKQGIQPIEENTMHIEVIEQRDGGYAFCLDGSVVHPRTADYYDRRMDAGVYVTRKPTDAPAQPTEDNEETDQLED